MTRLRLRIGGGMAEGVLQIYTVLDFILYDLELLLLSILG
jgi:hypothetical protein